MASTPIRRKRPKSDLTNPRNGYSSPSSSSSPSLHSFLPEPSPNNLPSKKSDFLKLIAAVAIAASVALVCNYVSTVFNRQPTPFCDSDVEFDDLVPDFCQPCPSNGLCYGGKLECIHGYRRHGKTCVEDGEIDELAVKLVKVVEVRVCEAYAQYICKRTGMIWVQEDELWKNINDLETTENYRSNEAYLLAKQRAVGNVGKLLEKRENSHGAIELKCPDSLMERYQPRTCKLQLWIAEHALVSMSVSVFILGFTLILLKLWRRHKLSVRAEELYGKICDILEENALHSRSLNGEVEPWVVASWLRDHLLLPRERRNPLLWKKVEELVQEDTRLNRYPKMVKGESKVVWEWQVEGSLSYLSKRKKSEQKIAESTKVQSSQHNSWNGKAGYPLTS